MSKRFLCSALAVGCLSAVLAPLPAAAQVCAPLDDGRVAEPFYEGTVIFWEPVVDYREMVLTISGPCEDIIKVFKKGEEISFDIREIERVTDGTYTWQLRRVSNIDPGVQEKLEGARGTGEEDALWWSFFQKGSIPEGPYVDSASFTVDRGVIIDPNQVEEKRATVASRARGAGSALAAGLTPGSSDGTAGGNGLAARDQVIPDDLIVQGSACVGFDCVNNESFGFDTIRLKENNTRIQFDDTSVGSFPTGNWQIRANSSSSGGQSFLGFVDQGASGTTETGTIVFAVEAGARANALYVESDGDVGLGTSNPVLDFHISSSNTPGLRLEQTNAGGFTAQTWDIAGNEANFFVRDVTGGSTLPFRIRPDAPSSSIDIASDGDVGIGTASPSAALHVSRNTGALVTAQRLTNNAGIQVLYDRTDVGANDWQISNFNTLFEIGVPGASPTQFSLNQNGNLTIGGTQYLTGSSRDLKENFIPVDGEEILERLVAMPLTEWNAKTDPEQRHIGPVAEDWFATFGLGPDDKHVSPTDIGGVALAAIKGLHEVVEDKDAAIAELERTVDGLQQQNSELAARLAAIEKSLASRPE